MASTRFQFIPREQWKSLGNPPVYDVMDVGGGGSGSKIGIVQFDEIMCRWAFELREHSGVHFDPASIDGDEIVSFINSLPNDCPDVESLITQAAVLPSVPIVTLYPSVGPSLGRAASFGAFGGDAGVTNTGLLTTIQGDIGTTGASTLVTGFHDPGVGNTYTETGLNVGAVSGSIFTDAPPPTGPSLTEGNGTTYAIAVQAAADALTAYNALMAMAPTATISTNLDGQTLTAGVYFAASTMELSNLSSNSVLILDGQNDPNALFVFQVGSALTVGAAGFPGSVVLINGAQSKNVFWACGSAATINGVGGGVMVGTIIALAGISFSTAAVTTLTVLNGRALALGASCTMVDTVIVVPAP